MTPRITGPKGAPDLYPPRSGMHDEITGQAMTWFRRYGYGRIETPVFEHTQLFEKGLEPGSDLVTKQMYTFEDRGGRSLTLRPDMTTPVVRAILEHGLDRQGLPVKLCYVAPIFRQERPQAGRQRQFTQVGVEAVGSDGPDIDAEVIQLALDVYKTVGLEVDLALNSIGHPGCRADYLPKLQTYLRSVEDQLCGDCQRKIDTNPLRTFDCKVESDRKLLENAPLIVDQLCPECEIHYAGVKDRLNDWGVKYSEDPRLVRGLDYYTRTAFEFTASGLGAQNAVGGGGRYDGLAEALGGPSLPGIGFGLGVERIALALESKGVEHVDRLDVFIVAIGDRARTAAFSLAPKLREAGFTTDMDYAGRSLKGQFKAANSRNAAWVIVIGEQELESGRYTVKLMHTGDEEKLPPGRIVGYLAVRS
ncbi:MAG TPA: histidine--tRNA ligase [Actinomycetota bacterium]|nr:histidine--tRNA ligase [Actinomycetota bacterium]